jgi:hypothetical protein
LRIEIFFTWHLLDHGVGHCPAAPESPALLSVFLFGSTTVAFPIGDMFERGELTNVLEDQKISEEIL